MRRDKSLWRWLGVAGLVHMAMFGYDLAHPEVFLHTDRAGPRFEAVNGLLASFRDGGTVAFLTSHGNPGDYLPQALVYGGVGQYGLIVLQVALALLSGWAVYRIARLLAASAGAARAAAVVYLALPHTLVFPHQLASEAIYSPLLVLSLWQLCEAAARRRCAPALNAGLLAGLANLVRPVTLLWPVAAALLFASARRTRAGVVQLVAAAVPVLLWMGFMATQTGHFSMGESTRDLGHNLYQRVLRMSATLPTPAAQAARRDFLGQGDVGSLAVADYLRFALRHPAPFANHGARDVAIFASKSGIERLTIDYLPLSAGSRLALQDSRGGWRSRLESEGVAATLGFLWRTQGAVLLVSMAGSVLMLVFSALSAYGMLALWRDRLRLDTGQRLVAAVLATLPLYVLVMSQLVDALQSRHRAPAEAAMVLLAGYGMAHFARRRAEQGLPAAATIGG